jgi:hypothetical protein
MRSMNSGRTRSFRRQSRYDAAVPWPLLIGQLAVIANGVIDTAMTSRFSSADLAALAVGASIYVSSFVGLSGVLQAVSPIIGQLYGARKHDRIGFEVRQSLWLALPGGTLAKAEFGQDEHAKKTLEKIDALTVGLSLADDIQAHITITAKSAEAAGELAKVIKEGLEQAKGLVTVLAGSQKELAPVADILGAITTSTEGNAIVLKGGVSAETLEKSLKKGQ